MKNKKILKLLFSCWSLFALILPQVVFAQTASGGSSGFPMSVPDTDISKSQIIDYLFGPLVGNPANNPFGDLLGSFSGAVLLIGGLLVAYTLLAGTLATAHEGEMLGRKWSSVWIPLRISLGTSLLLPVPGMGGFCMLQYIVIWLSLQGIGIADMLWNTFTVNPIDSTGVFTANITPALNNIAVQMINGNICVQGQKKAVQLEEAKANNGASNINSATSSQYAPIFHAGQDTNAASNSGTSLTSNAMDGQDLVYSITYGLGTPAQGCGSINYHYHSQAGQPINMMGNTSASSIQNLFSASNGVGSQIILTYQTQLAAMNQAISDATQQVVDNYSSADGTNNSVAYQAAQQNLAKVVATQVSTFQSTIQTQGANAYQAFFSGYNPLADLQKSGWLMAGSYYMYITRAISNIEDAVTGTPEVTPVSDPSKTLNYDPVSVGAESGAYNTGFTASVSGANPAYAYYQYAHQIMSNTQTQLVKGQISNGAPSTLGNESQLYGNAGSGTDNQSTITKTILGYFKTAGLNTQLNASASEAASVNPVILVQQIGLKMINVSWGILGVAAVGGIFSGTIGNLGLALFGAMIVPGATFAYYIPMLPFILWIGAVVGWVVLLVEAVIAAPLWAVSHLAPDGDGIVGRAGQGYMLVLSLTLKPALMIIGLVVALVLMNPIGKILNMTFLNAFNIVSVDNYGNPSTGLTAVTATLAGIFIYVSLMVSLVRRIFDLIHIIPDTVLRWLGAPGGRELGEGAHAAGQSERGVLAGMGAMKLASDAAGGIAGGLRQDQQRLRSKARDKKIENTNKTNKAIENKKNALDQAKGQATENRKTDEQQAMMAATSKNPALLEKAQMSATNSRMNEAQQYGKTADAAGNPVYQKSTIPGVDGVVSGIPQLDNNNAPFSQKREALANQLQEARTNGNSKEIGEAKERLDNFDNTAMDLTKAHVNSQLGGDNTSLPQRDRNISEAAESRDSMFKARSDNYSQQASNSLERAQSNVNAASADPAFASAVQSAGGIENLVQSGGQGYNLGKQAQASLSQAQESFNSAHRSAGISELASSSQPLSSFDKLPDGYRSPNIKLDAPPPPPSPSSDKQTV